MKKKFLSLAAAAAVFMSLFGTQPVYAAESAYEPEEPAQAQIYEATSDTVRILADRRDRMQIKRVDDGSLVIALDPGHGGSDNGATANGLVEKTVNLKIASYLKSYLETYEGVTVYMTRDTDTYIGLQERVDNAVAANADLFISLHNNSGTSASAMGSEVYYPNSSFRSSLSADGRALAESILANLEALGLENRGAKVRGSETGSTYEDGSLADYYAVIKSAKLAGICGIIVEHAFLTNAEDAAYLSSDKNLQAIAMADAQGIVDFLSLEPEIDQTPRVTLSSPETGEILVSWDQIPGANGYLVYRSTKSNKGFQRIGKLSGSSDTAFLDDDVPVGSTYYYKVRSYRNVNGYVLYSDYSDVLRGYTIGGTKITRVQQKDNYLKLWWNATENADGYMVYRKVSGGRDYEAVKLVTGKTSYADRSVEDGVNYIYKIAPVVNLYGNEGYGADSQLWRATYLAAPEIKSLSMRTGGSMKLVWYKSADAAGYEVYRAESEDGDYRLVTTTAASRNYYVDKETEIGRSYYYQVRALQANAGAKPVEGLSMFGETYGFKNFGTPELKAARLSTKKYGIYLKWSNVEGAESYKLYRSKKQVSGYSLVANVKPASGEYTDYMDVTDNEPGVTYYYKVKAVRKLKNGKNAVSDGSNVRAVMAGYTISGVTRTDLGQMVRYFNANEAEFPELYEDYGASSIEEFVEIVYEEAETEGVRAEVVFAQVCKETGFLRFGGDVSPEQCNFAGIGATGGVAGNSFPDIRTGLRAQVQHLKAYATVEELVGETVDPRYEYVKKGSAPYVEWLGINENPYGVGWATGIGYGYSLRDDYIKPMLEA